MTFPLVQLPKRVIYIDDSGSFLEALQLATPRDRSREFCKSPGQALVSLKHEMDYWRGITNLLGRSHLAKSEGLGEAALFVRSYFSDWRRFHLTGVLIVDFGMPELNGLELIGKLAGFPARRILLTGEADSQVAIGAFNAGLIQKFIPKAAKDLYKELTRSYEDLHANLCEHMGHLLRPAFTPAQLELLQDSRVADGLKRKIEKLGWTEYLAVGAPFGLLGMAHEGPLQWMQIETPETLSELAEAVSSYGYSEPEMTMIRDGTALTDWELHSQLGISGRRPLVSADEVCSVPSVLVGVSDIHIAVLTAKTYGIDNTISPTEVMQSLIRDVSLAHRQIDGGDGIDREANSARLAYEQAMTHLIATARQSEFHRMALHSALEKMTVEEHVRGEIDRRLQGGGKTQ